MLDRRDPRGIGIYPRRAIGLYRVCGITLPEKANDLGESAVRHGKELARKHAIIGGVAIWTGRQGPA